MTHKLKIIPLGGLGEIGKNMTAIEFGTDIIVVDCGLGFPDEDMYGIDIVIPDISYLKANAEKVRGIVITHGHEDHIGAVPYVIHDLNVPIYATPLTAALIELKLEEHDLLYNTQIFTKKAGDIFRLGCFSVEFIAVNHSIADAVALAIKTPIGTIVHTGDFKIDLTPVQGKVIDLPRFGQLGNEGVLALLSDSTNVEKPGLSASERKVGETFDKLFKNCDQRIIITTFASNVHRLQQIIDVAAKYKRKVAITGRSMENILRVATVLGYLNAPENVLVDLAQINKLPKDKVVIISTGSQGETMSALYRMAFSEHRQINIAPGDRVIISASAIPGNENMISKVIDELFHKGAEVIYDRNTALHVSGHASQEEQKMMLALVRPKFFIPVHGEYRHMNANRELALTMGMKPQNIFISDLGKVLEIDRKGARWNGTVPAGNVLVDGLGIGDVGNIVLRDRRHLAQDGLIVVVASVDAEDRLLISGPDIVSRGFVYVRESEALMDEVKALATDCIIDCLDSSDEYDRMQLKTCVKDEISKFLYSKTKRKPMILPVIMNI